VALELTENYVEDLLNALKKYGVTVYEADSAIYPTHVDLWLTPADCLDGIALRWRQDSGWSIARYGDWQSPPRRVDRLDVPEQPLPDPSDVARAVAQHMPADLVGGGL